MQVDLMRYIDYYVGVPLTFIITLIVKFCSIFTPAKEENPKNILFIELSEMGSTILADPAMKKAKKAFGADLFFCIFSKNRESLLLLNTVDKDNIFVIRENSFINLVADSIRFLFWTRERRIDTVIDLELFSRYTAILAGLSGAANRVGFFSFYYNEGLYRGNMLTHKVAYSSHMHIAKNFIDLVNALIWGNKEQPYVRDAIEDSEVKLDKVYSTEEEKDAMWDKVKKECPHLNRETHHLVLMNPNASDLLPQRRWPIKNFANLIQMILDQDKNAMIVITGDASEREEMQTLTNMINNERCINFTGKLKIRELPVLYSISTLMVTNDSGPAHFSAITDIPTFVLFGPETPDLYGSLGNSTPIYANLACSPCVTAANYRKTPCKNNVCLQDISEKAVFNEIKPYLRNN